MEAGQELDLLGVTFDRKMRATPYLRSLKTSTKSIAGKARCLNRHLPVSFVKRVITPILVGKVGYAAAAVAAPRLTDGEPAGEVLTGVQTGINDVARAILGVSLKDRIPVSSLLQRAQVPSYNQMVVKAVALETWKALRGPYTPLTGLLTENKVVSRPTRQNISGKLPRVSKFPMDTFICHAQSLWNNSSLRDTLSLTAAKNAVKSLLESLPL